MEKILEHSVKFYEDQVDFITTIEEGHRQIYIVMRRVCENLGLAWQSQQRKLREHHRFQQGTIMVPVFAQDGSRQESVCLHRSKFFLWLYSINPDKVAPEVRSKLIKYQDEVEDAIERYFTQGIAIYDSSPQRSTTGKDVFGMVASQARLIAVLADEMYQNRHRIEILEKDMSGVKHQIYLTHGPSPKVQIATHQSVELKLLAKEKGQTRDGVRKVWSKFKRHFHVSRYVYLPADRFEEALAWLRNL